MKKKIFILILILLLTTGCTCEYNLTIDDNTFKESISLIASTNEDVKQFEGWLIWVKILLKDMKKNTI